jgi:beta-glucuronidase
MGLLAVCEVPLYQLGRPVHSTKTLESAKHQLIEMIHAHKNHPSIGFWSVSNENMTRARGEGDDVAERTQMVVDGNIELVDLAHRLDPTRPVIEPSNCWPEDPVLEKTDFLSVNVYLGSVVPRTDYLDDMMETMHERMDLLRETRPGKPILVTEFGVWCIRGLQTDYYPGEGYQAGLLSEYWKAFLEEPGFVGAFIWVFADSDVHRQYVSLPETRCAYGVYDIHRRPKKAVEAVRGLWREQDGR